MKIVLFALNGSFSHSNLAIRCLRPRLERAGHEVVLIEHNLRDRSAHVLEHLYSEHADVYGFSCYIWNLREMLPLAESLKSLLPKARIVLGGPEASFATERFDGMDWIDAIVCGEGERAFFELCQAFSRGEAFERIISGEADDAFDEAGILYRDGEAS